MQNDLYSISLVWTEDFSEVTLPMTKEEAAIIERVFDKLLKDKDLDYRPTATIINLTEMQKIEEERKKEAEAKAEAERKEAEAKAEAERLEDIRTNGAIAVAFRHAQEKKNKK